jgi:hypothetical protein
LTYSANYLLHTAGLKWAIDPFHLSARLDGLDQPDYAVDLNGISVIVLTHIHADHVDWQLIQSLSKRKIKWVIPDPMLDLIMSEIELPLEDIIVPKNHCLIRVGPLSLHPFDGLHFRGQNGVSETGYLAEFNGKKWLFPGDTRKYDARQIPEMPDLNGMVVHLWLGKGSAARQTPPLLKEFCDFCRDILPENLLITHLYELGRDEHDLWDLRHYQLVVNQLANDIHPMQIRVARMGDRISLDSSPAQACIPNP